MRLMQRCLAHVIAVLQARPRDSCSFRYDARRLGLANEYTDRARDARNGDDCERSDGLASEQANLQVLRRVVARATPLNRLVFDEECAVFAQTRDDVARPAR
jgi:hypothetical protein